MDSRTTIELLRSAIPDRGGIWADLGAGDGVFTRALAEVLGEGSRVYAVDRDARDLAALERQAEGSMHDVVSVIADFTRPLVLPGLGEEMLDGILLANSLHFVPDAEVVLALLVERVRRGGLVVLIEYDRRAASQWVPYPIRPGALAKLAASAGLSSFVVTTTIRSKFGGNIYVAAASRK